MRKSKRHALEAHGWRVGSVADFLELTPEEVGVVQFALRRSDAPRAPRETPGMPPAPALTCDRPVAGQSRRARGR
jgi:hypothetical protein